MKPRLTVSIFILVVILNTFHCYVATNENVTKLPNEWFSAEDEMCSWLAEHCPFLANNIRPVANYKDPVNITKFSIIFGKIMELDDFHERLTIFATFKLSWPMPSCTVWNLNRLKKFSNLSDEAKTIEVCDFPSDQLWFPRLRMLNAFYNPMDFEDRRSSKLTIHNDGRAEYYFNGHFSIMCPIDFAVSFAF